jgi:peptide/nickel transport system substrate-binding protein
MLPGPAEGRVAEFLEPFAADLLPGAMEGYVLPVSDGSERNRAGIAEALRLMEEAGYTVEKGVMTAPTARPSPSRSCCRTDRPRTTPS